MTSESKASTDNAKVTDEQSSALPTESEGAPSVNKSHLQDEKLRLEIRALSRQTSNIGFALEWLKSAGVLVALVGIAVTLYIGFRQTYQYEQSRLGDRFEKALNRLASDKPNERMAGVLSLSLFLNEHDASVQASALNFLVNAVSVETDSLVQSAILDVFRELKPTIDQAALDEALATTIQRNRSLANSVLNDWDDRIMRDITNRLAEYNKLKPNEVRTPIGPELLAKLSIKQRLDVLLDNRGPFERLDLKTEMSLRGLATTITTLLSHGAKAQNFSEIYCDECDFTSARDLHGTAFDSAYLNRADFSHLNLKAA